jgi:hypothetical protein
MFANSQKRTARILGLSLLAGTMFTLASAPAHAGFSWTPPPAPPPKEKAVAPDMMTPAPLAPVEENDKAPAPMQAAAPAPAPVAMAAPAPAPAGAAPAVTTPPPMAMPEYAEIKGFGSGIPLTMALHQIVPADYSWSFAPGIDPGTSVSWQGDRPWNVVLNESLQPAGLTAVMNGHAVSIQRAGGMSLGDQMRGAMAAEGAWMGPIEQRYSSEQLAAIGMNSANNPTNFKRHVPRKIDNDRRATTSAETAPQSGDTAQSAPPPPSASPASVTVGDASAQGGPTPLADHMQQDNGMMPAAGMPPPPAALDVNAISMWKAQKGQSLHDTLKEWCDKSNVELIWEAHKDYPVDKKLSVNGTFPEAVMKLLTAYNAKAPRPVGHLHPNLPNGPSVLVIDNPA